MTEETRGDRQRKGDEPRSEGDLLRQQLEAVTDLRLDKIEAICRSMASGEYSVDPRTIAERMLAKMDDPSASER